MSRSGLTVASAAALIPLAAFVAWLLGASAGAIVVVVTASYGVIVPLAFLATPRASAGDELVVAAAEGVALSGVEESVNGEPPLNIWELERTAAELRGGDAEADYERSLLLVYLRDFSDSTGRLSDDFAELVREAFPAHAAESPVS